MWFLLVSRPCNSSLSVEHTERKIRALGVINANYPQGPTRAGSTGGCWSCGVEEAEENASRGIIKLLHTDSMVENVFFFFLKPENLFGSLRGRH